MMMLNVNQRLARANQEKTREKKLYYTMYIRSQYYSFKLIAPTGEEKTHQSLNMQEKHPNRPMATLIKREEINKRINARCKTTVQPSPPLPNQLNRRLRNIRLSFRWLDVCERPAVFGFGDELEA